MNINQGEIWEVEFFPKVGSEITKKRPAIVINHDLIGKLPLKTIVPITNWSNSFENYPWMYKLEQNELNGLSKISGVDCFQIKNFSINRFKTKIGIVNETQLQEIHNIVIKTLNPKYKCV